MKTKSNVKSVQNKNNILNTKTNTSITINTKIQSKSKLKGGCCSIILQIDPKPCVCAYKQESNYAADLYLKKVKVYGMKGLKEYKKPMPIFSTL